MSIVVQKSGLLTTVQDLGRVGFCRYGVNPSGVMDRAAMRLINALLANDDGEGVLEMHFPAPEILFEANAVAALGGADFGAELGGRPLENWRPFTARQGSVLTFRNKRSGNRAYLGVRGGFQAGEWLGSSSTNLAAGIGGFQGRKLEAGDKLHFKLHDHARRAARIPQMAASIVPHYSQLPTARIVAGAEYPLLDTTGRKILDDRTFAITNASDRMGFRLAGAPLALVEPVELVSSSVSFGTIQLLPNGQLIVLMADHQTSGGYPRIGHVITRDLPLLAQLGPGDKLGFHLIETADAEKLLLDFETELNFLRVGCKFQQIE
jgi:antagonist of KipI